MDKPVESGMALTMISHTTWLPKKNPCFICVAAESLHNVGYPVRRSVQAVQSRPQEDFSAY